MTPRVVNYQEEVIQRRDKDDVARANQLFVELKGATTKYQDLVKSGKIDPNESPVFRFHWNELKGSSLGHKFDAEVANAYNKSGLNFATDTTQFNQWFNTFKQGFVESNQDILSLDGAFDTFNSVANSTQNSLVNIHKSEVKQNFLKEGDIAFENTILNTVGERGTLPYPDEQKDDILGIQLNKIISDYSTASGGYRTKSQLNRMTVDILYKRALQTLDYQGFEGALLGIKTQDGKSSIRATAYANDMLIQARREISIGMAELEKADAQLFKRDQEKVQRTVNDATWAMLISGKTSNEDIENLTAQFEANEDGATPDMNYYDSGAKARMMELRDKWLELQEAPPMESEDVTNILQEFYSLAAVSPEELLPYLQRQIDRNKLWDTELIKTLHSKAYSALEAKKKGEQNPPDPLKDSVWKSFSDARGWSDKLQALGINVPSTVERNKINERKMYLTTSYLDLWDKGEWQKLTRSKQLEFLNTVMRQITDAPSVNPAGTNNVRRYLFGEDLQISTFDRVEPVLIDNQLQYDEDGEILLKYYDSRTQ
tara:strand:- start:5010 stop:6638 length:1629 start_codon:yes stop_codon:yes gene_type:complete